MTQPLFKKNKNGSVQTWYVTVEGYTITVCQGQVGGQHQSYITKCVGKNLGKKNETTSEQQAVLEAQSKWKKKQERDGYTTDPSGVKDVFIPMKISTFQKHGHKLNYPILATTKLNGVNATYTLVGDELILTSRTAAVYPKQPHLEQEVKEAMKALGVTRLVGELYHHGSSLQTIVSWVKKPKEGSKNLRFYIFDIPEYEGGFEERYLKSFKLFPSNTSNVDIVQPYEVFNEKDMLHMHKPKVKEGYEGLVLHNKDSLYTPSTRSMTSMKYKEALDAEFRIISHRPDKLGHTVFTCEAESGYPFDVKCRGTNEERLAMTKVADSYIEKWLTVEYECLTDAPKCIPAKPVGVSFRCKVDGTFE